MRDRSIILACLMLYALGMMGASAVHAIPAGDGEAYILCTLDGDGALAGDQDRSCPYCRLMDIMATLSPAPLIVVPSWVFANFIAAPLPPLLAQPLSRHAPPRAPPFYS